MKKENNLQELMRAIREGELTPERSGEYWSTEEREEMMQCFRSGIGISEIALQLQRSEMAVVQQLMTAGLLTSPGASRPRRAQRPKCLCPGCAFNQSQCSQIECRMRGELNA